MSLIQKSLINHIALVLDASGSMQRHKETLVKVVDQQIAQLAKRSKELDQETRVSVYTFDYAINIRCIIYDKDVLRLPSLVGHYKPDGYTALAAATHKAIDDLQKTAQIYGDHAFLIYVLTDGAENDSGLQAVKTLGPRISALPENWTLATFVPDAVARNAAMQFGFPRDNIAIWNTSGSIEDVGVETIAATDRYMTARAKGSRGTKNLFNMTANNVTPQAMKALQHLHPGQYRWLDVQYQSAIAPYVEQLTGRAYRMGEAYYQLTKPEKIQPDKQIALLDHTTKHLFTGDNARTLLNLPQHEVKVAPVSHPNFTVFVQSKSVNRKLVPGTKILLVS